MRTRGEAGGSVPAHDWKKRWSDGVDSLDLFGVGFHFQSRCRRLWSTKSGLLLWYVVLGVVTNYLFELA